MAKEVRVLRDDVLLKELDKQNFRPTGSVILYTEDKTAPENKLRFYEVMGLGPKVKDSVKVGDTIVVSWLDTMPPFVTENGKRTITTEDKICGILTQ